MSDLRREVASAVVLISAALRQHGAKGNLIYSAWMSRWFHTFKAIICILLNRYACSTADYPIVIAYVDGGKGWSEYGTMYWSESLVVGWGWRRGWWYALVQDSSH